MYTHKEDPWLEMYLDEVLVVLHDDVVLVEPAVEVRLGAARVVHDVELVGGPTRLRFHVDAVVTVDGTLQQKERRCMMDRCSVSSFNTLLLPLNGIQGILPELIGSLKLTNVSVYVQF